MDIQQKQKNIHAMKTQVLKYGGFYIGRFEAGVNSTTLRTKVTTNQTVVCKKGVAPYSYVPWGKAMNDVNTAFAPSNKNPDNVNTNGAVYLAKNFASQNNYTSVTSTLIYGCQWDAMCRYIGDSQRTTPKKSAPELTGSVSTDVSKNIYDLSRKLLGSGQWRPTVRLVVLNTEMVITTSAGPVSDRSYALPTYDSGGTFRSGPHFT